MVLDRDNNVFDIPNRGISSEYVRFVIRDSDSVYLLSVVLGIFDAKELYLVGKDIDFGCVKEDLKINRDNYDRMREELVEVTKGWQKKYRGNVNDNCWQLIIKEYGNDAVVYEGSGNYPDNWNSFMDIMIREELFYKENRLSKNNKIRGRRIHLFVGKTQYCDER